MAIGVDRDLHRLAGTDALELGFLVIGVDEDVVERHHIGEPLPGLDEIAGIDEAVGEGAVDRRAHRGEVEVALRLGELGLQFRKLRAGLGLLRLRHLDIVARGVVGRLRRFHRRDALVAAGFGNFEGGARGKSLGAQRLLAIEVETGALQRGFRGGELRLGLLDRAFQRRDLTADAVDGGLLGRDPGARGVDRDAIIAVVDPENHVAGANDRVVAGQDRRDMARDPRAEHGVVGADIGVVGRDVEPPDQNEIDAVADRGQRQQSEHAHHDEFALARFRRRCIGPGGRRDRPVGVGRVGRSPRGDALLRPRCGSEAGPPAGPASSAASSCAVSGSARTMRAAWSLAAAIKASSLRHCEAREADNRPHRHHNQKYH